MYNYVYTDTLFTIELILENKIILNTLIYIMNNNLIYASSHLKSSIW